MEFEGVDVLEAIAVAAGVKLREEHITRVLFKAKDITVL